MRTLKRIAGRAVRLRPGSATGLLFSCQGGVGARPGMGAELFAAEPAFRESVEAVAPIVARRRAGLDALAFFRDGGPPPRTKAEEIALLGVVQIAQCDLWRSVGVVPDAAIGVSLGEVTAAYAVGALGREDAAATVAAVAGAVTEPALTAIMFRIAASSDEAMGLARTAPAEVEFLGTITPFTSMVLCRAEDAAAVRDHLGAATTIEEELPTDRTYHTHRLVPTAERLRDELRDLAPRPAARPLYSSIGGRDISGEGAWDSLHWRWMVSHPYFYGEAVAAALMDGYGLVVNIGAHPHMTQWLVATADSLGRRVRVVDTTRNDAPERATWGRARRAVQRPRRGAAAPGARPPIRAETLDLDRQRASVDAAIRSLTDLQREGPVHFLPRHGWWVAVRPDAARTVLTEPEVFSSRLADTAVGAVLLGSDPPDHAAPRSAVTRFLGASAVDALCEDTEEFAREALAARLGDPELDLVATLAAPVVDHVTTRLLGIAPEEVASFRATARAKGTPSVPATDQAFDALRTEPRLTAQLAAAHPFGDGELDGVLRLIWLAGTVTTERHIAWSALLLGRDPELRARIAANRALLDPFLDEALRLHPSEALIARRTTRDTELAGVSIPAGSVVQASLGAANRDPERFPEPDRVRLDRRASHLSFGTGRHRCPGARLARAEATAAIRALLDVTPDYEVVQPDCALRRSGPVASLGLERLVVRPGVSAPAPTAVSS
jgi:cytochrome P450